MEDEKKTWQVYNQAGLIVRPVRDSLVEFCFVLRRPWHRSFLVNIDPLGKQREKLKELSLVRQEVVIPTRHCPLPGSPVLNRVRQALGNDSLQYGVVRYRFPQKLPQVAYCGLTIGPQPAGHSKQSDGLYLERRKWTLCISNNPAAVMYGFLSGQAEANHRIKELITLGRQFNAFRDPTDAVTTQTIGDLFLRLYAGFDTPLLRKDLLNG